MRKLKFQVQIMKNSVSRDTLSVSASLFICIMWGYSPEIAIPGAYLQEEKFFFPECEKRSPGSMVDNVEQHHLFQQGLETLKEYCIEVQQSPSTYHGTKVVEMVEAFAAPFVRHLHDEIDTLAPQKLRSIFPDKTDLKKTHNTMIRWIVSNAPKTKMLPWVSYSLDAFNGLDVGASRCEDCTLVSKFGYSICGSIRCPTCPIEIQREVPSAEARHC